jgi:hypothetical protein
VFDFPVSDLRSHAIEWKKRQKIGIKTFDIDLKKIEPLGRQARKHIVAGDTVHRLFSNHCLDFWNQSAMFDYVFQLKPRIPPAQAGAVSDSTVKQRASSAFSV